MDDRDLSFGICGWGAGPWSVWARRWGEALGLEGWGAVVGMRDKKSLSTGLRLLV